MAPFRGKKTAESKPDVIIHHLTDIHIGPLHYQANRALKFVEAHNPGWNNLGKYVNFLATAARTGRRLPDLVIVSGDLTSYAAEAEFNKASDQLVVIRDLLAKNHGWRREGEPCIFVVPGNHDLDWSKQDYGEKIERFTRMANHLGPLVKAPISLESGIPFFDFGPERKLLIYLFNSCVLGGTYDEEIAGLFRTLAADLPPDQHSLQMSELERIARKDPGYIHPQQLETMVNTLPDDHRNRLKIAVMHHNPSSVPSDDIDSFDTIINSGMVKRYLLKKEFDVVLHGHRHISHCSYEEYLPSRSAGLGVANRKDLDRLPYQQGLYVLSGDALGTKETSRFFELQLFDTGQAHHDQPPAALVDVQYAESHVAGYDFSPRYRFTVGRSITASIKYIQESMDRQTRDDLSMIRSTLRVIVPSLRRLQSAIDDWEQDSNWQRLFHDSLENYTGIYGVDLLGPTAWLNPNYLGYIATEFAQRERQLRRQKANELRFSTAVRNAVIRTGWNTEPASSDFKISPIAASEDELEIVRVLLWDETTASEHSTLEMIDRYHRLVGAPIFVLNPSAFENGKKASRKTGTRGKLTQDDANEEFVVAKDRKKRLQCFCFRLDDPDGKVRLEKDGQTRYDRFVKFLEHEGLMTIPQFLNLNGSRR